MSVLTYQFCIIFSQMKIGNKSAVALSQRYGTKYVVGSIIDVICKSVQRKRFACKVIIRYIIKSF